MYPIPLFAQDLNPPTQDTANTPSSSGSNTLFPEFAFAEELVGIFVSKINYFTLAWCIFYTFFFLIQFFEYRMFNSGGEFSNEKNGMEGIKKARPLWLTYLACVFCYLLFSIFDNTAFGLGIGIFTILAYVVKLFFDFISIMELLNYFGWSSGIADKLKDLVKINK